MAQLVDLGRCFFSPDRNMFRSTSLVMGATQTGNDAPAHVFLRRHPKSKPHDMSLLPSLDNLFYVYVYTFPLCSSFINSSFFI